MSGDADVGGDNKLVGVPFAVAAVVGRPPWFAFGWVRYRLMTIFSKNHLLPMFCIVCLRLHIYRYLGLKQKSNILVLTEPLGIRQAETILAE